MPASPRFHSPWNHCKFGLKGQGLSTLRLTTPHLGNILHAQVLVLSISDRYLSAFPRPSIACVHLLQVSRTFASSAIKMTIAEGAKLPMGATFNRLENNKPTPVPAADIFAGKKVRSTASACLLLVAAMCCRLAYASIAATPCSLSISKFSQLPT